MRVGFLARPGWLALTAGVVVFAIACFTVLAPWQFRRYEERQARNDAVRSSFETPPQPITELPADPPEWRQVVLTGSYLPDAEVLARLRTVEGEPAFEVLTPMRLTGGEIVLVDRGFVRPASGRGAGVRGNQVPDYAAPPTGEVTAVGRLRRDEGAGGDRAPVTDAGRLQVYAIDSATVGAATGLPLRPGYVQLNTDQPGVLGALPLPQLESGPSLAYGLQWIAFGVMAIVGWGLMVRRELTERAAARAARGAAAGAGQHREHG